MYNQCRGKGFHIIACVSDLRLMKLMVQSRPFRGRDVSEFLQELLGEPKNFDQRPFSGKIVFLDNASVHRSKLFRDAANKTGALAVFNCPYAPANNFCEQFILLHKAILRKHFSSLK